MGKIVILDVAQQGNSGDDIMQRALLELTGKYLSTDILMLSYFGSNEFLEAKSEFTFYSKKYGIDVEPGVAFTYVYSEMSSFYLILRRLMSVANVFLFCMFNFFCLGRLYALIFMSKEQRRIMDLIRGADKIVWNGRNFRGSASGGVREALKIFELCLNPLICGSLNKEMVNFGSSVWPLKSKLSRWVLSKTVRKCKKFFVREHFTLSYLLSIFEEELQNRVEYAPDLSLLVLSQLRQGAILEKRERNLVTLTIVGRREISDEKVYAHYLKTLSTLVSRLHENGYRIMVVPQVSYDQEPYKVELELLRSSNADVCLIEAQTDGSVESLLNCYARSAFLIASRMHSAIYALSVDTPVYAIAYDAGAKWSILDDLDVESTHNVSVESLEFDDISRFVINSHSFLINNEQVLSQKARLIENSFENAFS